VRTLPVSVVKAEQPANCEHAGRKQHQTEHDARHLVEWKPGRGRELWRRDRRHDRRVTGDASAANRAMVNAGEVHVAQRISPFPERAAAAIEDPVADVDEEQTGDNEGYGKRQEPVAHSPIIGAGVEL
jgi:hypothetical protein